MPGLSFVFSLVYNIMFSAQNSRLPPHYLCLLSVNRNVKFSRQLKLSWLKIKVKRGYHSTADCVTLADVLLPGCMLIQGSSRLCMALECGENILQWKLDTVMNWTEADINRFEKLDVGRSVYHFLQYTECFTTLGHNCRRWFPRSLWSKNFI